MLIEAANLGCHAPGERVKLRLLGNDVCRTDRRVSAKERTLRAAQNFDAFDVEHQCQRPLRSRRVDAVVVDTDSRVAPFGGVGRTYTAQRDDRRVGLDVDHNAHVGNEVVEILDVADIEPVQLFL